MLLNNYNDQTEDSTPSVQQARNEGSETTKTIHSQPSNKRTFPAGRVFLFAALTLLSIFCLPMYNKGLIMGELYPNDQSVYFSEVMELISERNEPFRYYVVKFTVVALIFAVLLLMSSLFRSRTLSVITSLGGIAGMLYYLSIFISQEGADNVFNVEETAICIGFWVTLLLFFISFLISAFSHKQT